MSLIINYGATKLMNSHREFSIGAKQSKVDGSTQMPLTNNASTVLLESDQKQSRLELNALPHSSRLPVIGQLRKRQPVPILPLNLSKHKMPTLQAIGSSSLPNLVIGSPNDQEEIDSARVAVATQAFMKKTELGGKKSKEQRNKARLIIGQDSKFDPISGSQTAKDIKQQAIEQIGHLRRSALTTIDVIPEKRSHRPVCKMTPFEMILAEKQERFKDSRVAYS